MKTYIGAENIISPLGTTAKDNFNLIKNGQTGIKLFKKIGFGKVDVYLSKINETSPNNFFYFLLKQCLTSIIKDVNPEIIKSQGTIVLISTTKADIIENITSPIIKPIQQLKKDFNLHHTPIVVSNACISGVLAINVANNLIQSGKYKHAFVIGADVISDFVLYGFQSLFAISNEPCQPFDKNRKGITLGEGAGGVLVSNDSTVFESPFFEFVEGTSSNDANHISGPSRTGEGLFRTVTKTLKLAGIDKENIDFISAHGTATIFNDEMEAIAFDRLGMNNIPLNSLKGYFGHTLGASGLIETAICIQSLRNNLLIKSVGFDEIGTSKELNLLTQNIETEVQTILKTASGFGGCNASLIIRKL